MSGGDGRDAFWGGVCIVVLDWRLGVSGAARDLSAMFEIRSWGRHDIIWAEPDASSSD